MRTPRKNMIIFGEDAGSLERGVFGSLAAGLPLYSQDPDVIQSEPEWANGWFAAVLGANSPAIQDMNSFCFVLSYMIYLIQESGVMIWSGTTNYQTGSLACDEDGTLFVSISDDNLNNLLTDSTKWVLYGARTFAISASGSIPAYARLITADATSEAIMTVELPDLDDVPLGTEITIKAIQQNANVVGLNAVTGQTIDGSISYPTQLSTYDSVTVYKASATAWYVI